MAEEVAGAGDNGAKQVAIQRVYLKDSSFESPRAPEVFTKMWKPHVNLNMQTAHTALGEDAYEVVLTVTAEAKLEDENAFLCEVQQAGMFVLKGLNDAEMKQVLGSFCPNQLYPYAREAISDLVGKGGFPSLMLQPINFDALLQQHGREVEKARAEAGSVEERH